MEPLELEIHKKYIERLNVSFQTTETKINTLEQLAFKYDLFFLDAFGTLYNQNHYVYPGALEMVRYLRQKGKTIRLLTNAASQPVVKLLKELWVMGFDFLHEEVVTSGDLLTLENQKQNIQEAFYLGRETGVAFLEAAGITFSENPKYPVVILSNVVREVELREKAIEILKRPNSKLIVLNPDPWAPSIDGSRKPVSGAFAYYLIQQTNAEVIYLGKPFTIIFSEALKKFPKSTKAIMIGDSLGTDVLGACAAGIDSALILGRNTPKESVAEDEVKLGIRPTYYLSL